MIKSIEKVSYLEENVNKIHTNEMICLLKSTKNFINFPEAMKEVLESIVDDMLVTNEVIIGIKVIVK